MELKQDLTIKLNTLIMDLGVRGNMAGTAPININWRSMGRYMIAFLEDYDDDADYYRIFRCPEQSFYEEYRILHPDYEDDTYECLYDSIERNKVRTQLHIVSGLWIEDFLALCAEYYKECE